MALTKTPICEFGKKAENFELKSTENKIISLNDVKGSNGTLIMFICNHCPYVKAVIDDIVQDCKELEKHGFEIYIGSQSDPKFWINFYSRVGKIDILLDDGGHGNMQQIVTLSEAIDNTNDDGIIVTEDMHTSYMKKFGNPSRNSFVSYTKYLIDVINCSPTLKLSCLG